MSETKRSRAPTLADVARRAGVSVSTTARVLRNDDYPVTPELSERVRDAAAEVGYVPNILARSLRGGTPTTIGLIVGDMLDPFYGEVAEVVTTRAETEHSMVAIVCNMQRDPLLELKYCQQMWEHRVGGLILAGGGFDQWTHFDRFSDLIRQMIAAGVVVASLSPRGVAPAFCIDNEALGAGMAEALVSHGHRRIGILLGSANNEATQGRMRGAIGVLSRSGAGFHVVHSDYSAQSGAEAIAAMLEGSPGITGAMVGSDAMAVGVLNRLAEMGISVPDEFSVVGAGNTSMARWSSPRLTTFDLALTQCGSAALDFIAGRLQGGPAADKQDFAVRFVPGQTLAAAGSGGGVGPGPGAGSLRR